MGDPHPLNNWGSAMKNGFGLVASIAIGAVAIVGIDLLAEYIVRLEEKKKNGKLSK